MNEFLAHSPVADEIVQGQGRILRKVLRVNVPQHLPQRFVLAVDNLDFESVEQGPDPSEVVRTYGAFVRHET
ncbi:hypothetical protein AB0D56_35440 [Streptomyces sp. NPDC048209]|uniref:hypothetical protein n=1 Tax=Streptomyces TaxID=1883 RepID=UPI0016871574|nr:hypothetical protein [Streptomyces pratensis]